MRSQQLMWQSQTQERELPKSSKQQPGRLPQPKIAGIQAGIAALVLAALTFSLTLTYAGACAAINRNGYAQMALRREIEDARAQTALLRYQIHLAESSDRVEQTALGLGLIPGDPVRSVDYVLLPRSEPETAVQLAATGTEEQSSRLAAALAEFAAGVVTSAGGRAEASTADGHRP